MMSETETLYHMGGLELKLSSTLVLLLTMGEKSGDDPGFNLLASPDSSENFRSSNYLANLPPISI